MKKPPNPTTSIAMDVKGECGNCGLKDRWLFHRVMVRGVDRRLCTSCVLRLHPSSFCPSCFEFFDHPLSTTSSASAHRFMSCMKCSSLTHLHCLPSPPPPPSSFLCPPCSSPNFSFFPLPNPNSNTLIDKHLSLVLLCASKIAAASMAKSLTIAKARADRTLREAALARKRAKDALDHCSLLDKVKRLEPSPEVSGSRMGTNHKVVCKKEDVNGFIGGQVKVDVLPLPHPVNKNGNDCEQDLERVRSCHGRIVDVSSTT